MNEKEEILVRINTFVRAWWPFSCRDLVLLVVSVAAASVPGILRQREKPSNRRTGRLGLFALTGLLAVLCVGEGCRPL